MTLTLAAPGNQRAANIELIHPCGHATIGARNIYLQPAHKPGADRTRRANQAGHDDPHQLSLPPQPHFGRIDGDDSGRLVYPADYTPH